MPRTAPGAELKALARATRAYLEREAGLRRGDLWTLAARETPSPSKERPMARRAKSKAKPAEPGGPGFLSHADDTLEQVASEVRVCTRCGLADTRTKAVPGSGTGRAGIVFVGEAPGASEDARGEPFVGRAGDLLTRMIQAMDEKQLIPGVSVTRDSCFIMNVLKCRPPENRNPLPHEIEACSPYLMRQLALLKPRIICCLGKFAAELLVGAKGTIGGMRGTVYRYGGAKLIVTYHPAACLRNPAYKRPVWEDLQLLASEYQTP
jgi:DNA polymerase